MLTWQALSSLTTKEHIFRQGKKNNRLDFDTRKLSNLCYGNSMEDSLTMLFEKKLDKIQHI
jgi:hypothetical protein